MFNKCDPTEEKQILQMEILQYLFLQLEELFSHLIRCEMLCPFSFYCRKNIHSLSTSRKPLLLTLLIVAFRVLLLWSLYPLDVQLCLPCFSCCINAVSKAQLLDIFYSQIPFPDLGPEFWNNVADWVFAPSPPMLPQNPYFQSPSMTFLPWLPDPQPCQGSSTLSSAAFLDVLHL